MTTTPSTTRSSLPTGALVQIQHNSGFFKIACPTAWADADELIPTHYNVTSSEGRLHSMVPLERMTVCSNTASTAHLSGEESVQIQVHTIFARMLRHPELTRRMGVRLLGRDTAESLSLEILANRLVPKYKETHCWGCHNTLDNLKNEICPACGGIKCRCGGCRCNWPYPAQTAFSRRNFTSPAPLTGLHLPR